MANCRVLACLLMFFVSISLPSCYASIFDRVLGDVSPCVDLCKNTYSPHTYEKNYQNECCRRGCRLFTIMEFVEEMKDANDTKSLCFNACKEAYGKTDEMEACQMGCSNQQPISLRHRQQEMDMGPDTHLLYPLMYVHGMYSNMLDKVKHHMSIQWSYYMQADNGQLVVIRSQPQLYMEYNEGHIPEDFNTPIHLETNLAAVDNAATPDLKRSQLRSINDDPMGMNFAVDSNNLQSSDWLSCIANKTGVPRLILTGVVLLCAVFMIWLCLTAAHTAPDHHVKVEKLSINGDLEYLKEARLQTLMSSLYPQDRVEASPLPIKIRVERV